MKINIDKVIQKMSPKALRLLGNKGKLLSLSLEAIQKISTEQGLKDLSHEAILAIELVMDWAKGNYKGIKKRTLVKIVVAFLYLLNPIDIIPDVILGFGFLDDVYVFTKILKTIREELRHYEEWRKR